MIAKTPSWLVDAPFSDAGGLGISRTRHLDWKAVSASCAFDARSSFELRRWTILFCHHDCPHRQEAVPHYERMATQDHDRCLVPFETTPYGSEQTSEGVAFRSRLSSARERFVQTPVEIQVDDGIVVSASFDLPAVAEETSLFSQGRSCSVVASSALLTD